MLTLPRWLNRPIVAIIAVTAIAAGVRSIHLSEPNELIFDENYYATAACILVGASEKVCMIDDSERYWIDSKWDVGSWVHPPLGKWEIALGVKVFGMRSFGWRVSSVVAGTAVVTLAAIIAQLLFGSVLWTFVTGLLIAVENLNVVMSRVALLDIHLEFWIVLGFMFLLLDRRWIDRRTPPDEPEPALVEDGITPHRARSAIPIPVWRPWRFAAGLALGAAIAVKWSGAMAILGALILSFAWETTRRHRGETSRGRAFWRAVRQESLGLLLAFVFLPVVVYVASYLPWFNHFGWSFKDWWENQTAMFRYHRQLRTNELDPSTHTYTPTHPYYSRAWTWPFMLRPVNFFLRQLNPGIRHILAIGNPAVFWGSVWAVPFVGYMWRRRHDWQAGFILVPVLALYLPWLLVTRPQFFFYALPMTPFMVLAITYLLRDLAAATIVLRDPASGERVESSRHPYLPFVLAYVAIAVALFIWFWPVLTAVPLTETMWRARVWFRGWV